MRKNIKAVADEVVDVLKRVDEDELLDFETGINKAQKIFVSGTGRSGLIGKTFAIRLMHSGYKVFVVGETVTPSIGEKDLLIIISGSGNTGTLIQFAEKARGVDSEIALVTTDKNSKIGKLSNYIVSIPAATRNRKSGETETVQPMGSLFDQSAHLLLDSLIVHLIENVVDATQLKARHANLE